MRGYCWNRWSRNSKQSAGRNRDINFSPVCNINRRTNLPKLHIPNYASIDLAKCPAMRAIDLLLRIPPCLSMTINPSPFWVLRPSQSDVVSTTKCEPVPLIRETLPLTSIAGMLPVTWEGLHTTFRKVKKKNYNAPLTESPTMARKPKWTSVPMDYELGCKPTLYSWNICRIRQVPFNTNIHVIEGREFYRSKDIICDPLLEQDGWIGREIWKRSEDCWRIILSWRMWNNKSVPSAYKLHDGDERIEPGQVQAQRRHWRTQSRV